MNSATKYFLGKHPDAQKVAFFHSHNLWPTHLETELELMKQLAEDGIEIVSFYCDSILKKCDANPDGVLENCINCMKALNTGINSLGMPVKIEKIRLKNKNVQVNLPQDIDTFKEIFYENFEVGYATLSSVVSVTRDPYLDPAKYDDLFTHFYSKSIELFEFFQLRLKQLKPDIVIVFNGRFAYTRALVRACDKLGIPFYTHERGSSIRKYMLFPNTLPHDISYFNSQVKNCWSNPVVAYDYKKRVAEEFYIERLEGINQSWFSFITNQSKELLPENLNNKNYNIGVFLSSEDEFIAIGDQWNNGLFKNQLEGLDYIINKIKSADNTHFYIRIHPNSKDLNTFISKVLKLASDKVTIIEPLSPVSSYKLLMQVDKVLTFGSTIGIEASYWGKPSINIGNSFYKNLNVTYNPVDHSELENTLNNKLLAPIMNEMVFAYGYYLKTFGFSFELYSPVGIMDGSIFGKSLRNRRYYIKKIINSKVVWIFKSFPRLSTFLLNMESHLLFFLIKGKLSALSFLNFLAFIKKRKATIHS